MADTLLDVMAKAMADQNFFKALLKDVDAAAESYGLALSGEDRDKLKNAIKHPPTTLTIDVPKFLDAVHQKGLRKFDRWIEECRWIDPFKR